MSQKMMSFYMNLAPETLEIMMVSYLPPSNRSRKIRKSGYER